MRNSGSNATFSPFHELFLSKENRIFSVAFLSFLSHYASELMCCFAPEGEFRGSQQGKAGVAFAKLSEEMVQGCS